MIFVSDGAPTGQSFGVVCTGFVLFSCRRFSTLHNVSLLLLQQLSFSFPLFFFFFFSSCPFS